jgi:hypothetical protein
MDVFDKPRSDQCIERRYAFTPLTVFYSVSEYLDQFLLAELWNTPTERRKHDLEWIEVAPRPEKLTPEMNFVDRNGFRICNQQVYDSQMRALLALD